MVVRHRIVLLVCGIFLFLSAHFTSVALATTSEVSAFTNEAYKYSMYVEWQRYSLGASADEDPRLAPGEERGIRGETPNDEELERCVREFEGYTFVGIDTLFDPLSKKPLVWCFYVKNDDPEIDVQTAQELLADSSIDLQHIATLDENSASYVGDTSKPNTTSSESNESKSDIANNWSLEGAPKPNSASVSELQYTKERETRTNEKNQETTTSESFLGAAITAGILVVILSVMVVFGVRRWHKRISKHVP